jgi:Protein of unknown function (DUF3179)
MKKLAIFLGLAVAVLLVACGQVATPKATSPTVGAAKVSPTGGVIEKAAERPYWAADFWKTNWGKRLSTIELTDFVSGGPGRDGIPPLDTPKFVAQPEANAWVKDNEPVIVYENGGVVRAYPIQILTWHEIVNDVVGGKAVTITFCPLCNTAIAFDRTVDGKTLTFGTSGILRKSNLVMWDRQTESLWQQFDGDALVGDFAGKKLTKLPVLLTSYAEFKAAYPATAQVLSKDTGFTRDYGRNPYAGYDDVSQNPFLFEGVPDGRLNPMERVVTVNLNGQYAAYPFADLREKQVINDNFGGKDLVVFWKSGTASALDQSRIAGSRDIGSTGVYEAVLDGRKLTFEPVSAGSGNFKDKETGSTWNLAGKATGGTLKDKQLKPLVHGNDFWFVWAAFLPATAIRKG